jgi:DNA-binding CsgD family transcriptional regulator
VPTPTWRPAAACVEAIRLLSLDPSPQGWLPGFAFRVLRPLRVHCVMIGHLDDDAHLRLLSGYGVPTAELASAESVNMWDTRPYGRCILEGAPVVLQRNGSPEAAAAFSGAWHLASVIIGVPALVRGAPIGAMQIGLSRLGPQGVQDEFWAALPSLLGLVLMAAENTASASAPPNESVSEPQLSAEQIAIVQALQTELTQQQIADDMGISLSAFKWQCRRIYQVLQVTGRDDAVRVAQHLGHLP